MNPNVTFETLVAADIKSALLSLKLSGGGTREGIIRNPIGLGHELFLNWALQDIEASSLMTGGDRDRASVNAIMNARRALACLMDQYWQRDGFEFCYNGTGDSAK